MAALKSCPKLSARTMCLIPLVLLLSASQAQQATPGLYAQAASAMLNRSFPSGRVEDRVEYLLLDLNTGQTIAVRWSHADTPIPVGSLLKPFVALAYGQLHLDAYLSESTLSRRFPVAFPVVHCHGRSDGCWHSGGHGSLALEQALAVSCNAYFLTLARELSASNSAASGGLDALDRVSASYGLPAPPEPETPRTLIGVTPDWRVSPIALARAYATLAAQPGNEIVTRLLTGMKLAASPGGTAAKVGQHPGGVLAKTGTAPCVTEPNSNFARCVANGDGLVVVLAPAENPRLLLLVRQRGTTGAQTAELAGRMLSRLEDIDAQEL